VSADRPLLVLATANQHKLAELSRILAASQVEVELAGLAEFPGAPDVRETGATFAANALLKARVIAEFTGTASVADDSGLCVDALNGMPGVLSARWAGRHGDDEGNLRLVLAQLADVPDERRGAHFTCAAALVTPGGREQVSSGRVFGSLTHEPRGSNGFGYDPIFVPDLAELTAAPRLAAAHGPPSERTLAPAGEAAGSASADTEPPVSPVSPARLASLAGLTTAELSPQAKDAISHRARALRGLALVLGSLLSAG
jgi:XTP/dITP diphosphohydrolase